MELVTERLVLREFTADDLPSLTAYRSDPRYATFLGPGELGPEHTLQLLETFIRWRDERPRQNYQPALVERLAPAGPIGSCGVRCMGREAGQAEFGLELAPRCWGRGLATEAARALLSFAFQDFELREIYGVSVTRNERVTRLVKRLGFRPLGTRSGPDWTRARGWSQTEWRLTREDWRQAST